MKIALLKKYQDLEQDYEALEEKRKSLRKQIVEELNKEGVTSLESDYGRFTVATRTNYSYSDKVKSLEEKVKLAKLKEVQKGEARMSETSYLVFTQVTE